MARKTMLEAELELLARMCMKADIQLDFDSIPIGFYDDRRHGISLTWAHGEVEEHVFLKAWNHVRKPRFPRYVPQEERYELLDDFDPSIWLHEKIRRSVIRDRKLPEDLERHEYCRVLRQYVKLLDKSPVAGLSWAESQMRKHFPWFGLHDVALCVSRYLNTTFMPCSDITSYTEDYTKQTFELSVTHECGLPIVWHHRYTFGSGSVPVLDAVRVQLKPDRLVIRVGDKAYAIASYDDLTACLQELQFRINKIWLESMDGLLPGICSVNTLSYLALRRNEDYDTQVYRVTGAVAPNTYNLKETLEPTPFVYLDMYKTTEVNLDTKKGEN